jgi:hypothetical protein
MIKSVSLPESLNIYGQIMETIFLSIIQEQDQLILTSLDRAKGILLDLSVISGQVLTGFYHINYFIITL